MKIADILDDKGRTVHTCCRGSRWPKSSNGSAGSASAPLLVCDENGAIRGIVSERDIVRVTPPARAPRCSACRSSDVMTRYVETCEPEETVAHAMARMTAGRYRHLPVLVDGKLVGHGQHRRPGQAPRPRDGDWRPACSATALIARY